MADNSPVYLDYNATTPVDEAVLQEMLPYFNEKFGNAASRTHSFGWRAEDAVELARERIAKVIGAEPSELVFTSGSTEGINLAIKGVYQMYASKGDHIITVQTEHKAVLDTCAAIERQGAQITYLPVDAKGLVNADQLEAAITERTILISIMYANNETGVLQNIKALSTIAHKHDVIFMSDATQALGKVPLKVNDLGIDLMPISAHKFYGPKGVGALYVRRRGPRVRLMPQIDGGGHEKGLRSGTLNVPGIVGMGKAAELADQLQSEEHQRLAELRDGLQSALMALPGAKVHGGSAERSPNTLNISFDGVNAQQLVRKLADTVAVATGSACTSAIMEPSHVLSAMGVSEDDAYSSIRISLGRYTTQADIEKAIEVIKSQVG